MNKKVFIVMILAVFIQLIGCGNNIVENSIEKAKLSIESGDYNKALVSLEIALDEDKENSEAKMMYEVVSTYINAQKYVEENKFKEARRILLLLNEEYIDASMREDIEKLKDKVNENYNNKEKENKQSNKSKDKYLKKLDDLEDELKAVNYYSDNAYTTPEMVEAQGKVLKRWDDLLNEIYNLLKVQLSKAEMDDLTNKQVNWIKYRDMTAENEASVYEGGSFSRVERVASLGRLTKERCYELVNIYMK